jgi:hypothetical protein
VGLDVAVMTFTTGDEAEREILEYLIGLVKEGDDASPGSDTMKRSVNILR